MIARTWHGRVPTSKADDYEAYLRKTGLADYVATPGNLGAEVLRRTDGDVTDFVLTTHWDSLDAVKRFAGEDYTRARYYPEDDDFLLEREPFVEHFEVVESATPTSGFVSVLLAPEGAPGANLYDHFLGSWDLDVEELAADGTVRTDTAEWHFARVLEGRAIQDVFIVPALRSREPSDTSSRYGMTLRVFDPATGTWHITWTNPVTGAENRLVARREGSDIVQVGEVPGGLIRWSFHDIGQDDFRWRGEESSDGGRTWRVRFAFTAKRRSAVITPLTPAAAGRLSR